MLRRVSNKGMCLGLLSGQPETVRILSLAASAAVTVSAGAALLFRKGFLKKAGSCLAAAGAWSNTADRFIRGHVVDYIGFRLKNKKLAALTYNLADFYIAAGGVFMVLDSIRSQFYRIEIPVKNDPVHAERSSGLDIFPEVVDEEAFGGVKRICFKKIPIHRRIRFRGFQRRREYYAVEFFQYAVMLQRVVREENGRVGEKIDWYIPAGQIFYKIHYPAEQFHMAIRPGPEEIPGGAGQMIRQQTDRFFSICIIVNGLLIELLPLPEDHRAQEFAVRL